MQHEKQEDIDPSTHAPTELVTRKEHTMTSAARPLSPAKITGLSLAALTALALSACGPDDSLDTSADGEPNSTVTIGSGEEADAEEAAAEDADDATEDGSSGDADQETDAPVDSGDDHPVYGGLETVAAEHPDGVIFEVESDDGRYEWHIAEDGIEREIHTDKGSYEIVHTEDDDAPDGDDQREIEAIEIDMSEAFQAAEEHAGDPAGAFVQEAELDTRDGVVVWDIELDDGREVSVDVTSAEVLHVDD